MQNLSILFWQRTNGNIDKKMPIICRITTDGERVEVTTDVEIENRKWNQKGQKINGSSQEAFIGNSLLTQLKNDINEIVSNLKRDDILITAKTIKYKLSGGDNANKKYTLLNAYKEELDRMTSLKGNGYAEGSVVGMSTSLRNMEYYLSNVLKAGDLFVHQVDYKFIKEFEGWGTSSICKIDKRIKKRWKGTTIVKEMTTLRKIITEYLKRGIIKDNPFLNYVFKRDKPTFKFLTEEELKLIEDLKFSTDEYKLEIVRDVFIFSCYTGLAYADVRELNQDHLIKDINFGLCIAKDRVKTKTEIYVPLLEKPLSIINKYKDDELCQIKGLLLPIGYLRDYNSRLDIIAKKCNINKKVTTHVARHTAATLFLNNGIPEEIVCKAVGLASVAILKSTYGKLHNNTVTKHFSILNENLKKVSGV